VVPQHWLSIGVALHGIGSGEVWHYMPQFFAGLPLEGNMAHCAMAFFFLLWHCGSAFYCCCHDCHLVCHIVWWHCGSVSHSATELLIVCGIWPWHCAALRIMGVAVHVVVLCLQCCDASVAALCIMLCIVPKPQRWWQHCALCCCQCHAVALVTAVAVAVLLCKQKSWEKIHVGINFCGDDGGIGAKWALKDNQLVPGSC